MDGGRGRGRRRGGGGIRSAAQRAATEAIAAIVEHIRERERASERERERAEVKKIWVEWVRAGLRHCRVCQVMLRTRRGGGVLSRVPMGVFF